MFRSCQIIIRELCSLLKLYYSIHNSIRIVRSCQYCNITLARNKALWWWSDKIETCRSVLKVFYMKLYVHSLVDKLKWFYENARCYNKIYNRLSVEQNENANILCGNWRETIWPQLYNRLWSKKPILQVVSRTGSDWLSSSIACVSVRCVRHTMHT